MRILFSLLICLFIAPPPSAEEAPNLPMRGLIWGIPAESVKEFEEATFVGEEPDILIYTATVQPDTEKRKFKVYIAYHFTKNALDNIRYDIVVSKSAPAEALEDVLTWQSWLDYVFGQTSKPDFQFRSRNVRDDPMRWGWEIYKGEGSVRVNWTSPETKAVLSLSGDDYTPQFELMLTPAGAPQYP